MVLHFSGRFLLTASLRRRIMSVPTHETEISLKQEFLEITPANSGKFLKQLTSNLSPSLPQLPFKLQSNCYTHNRSVGTATVLRNLNSVSNKSSSLQSSTAISFINTAT